MTRDFEAVASDPRFAYVSNLSLGPLSSDGPPRGADPLTGGGEESGDEEGGPRVVTLEELREHFDAVVSPPNLLLFNASLLSLLNTKFVQCLPPWRGPWHHHPGGELALWTVGDPPASRRPLFTFPSSPSLPT